MPSSNKTATIGLNQWLGSDKPVKDDFNEDNRLMEETVSALTARVEAVEQTENGTALTNHIQNKDVHCTAEEKALWNAAGSVSVMTYIGTGDFMRTFELDGTPKAGMIFALNHGLYEIEWTVQSMLCYTGWFSADGGCTPIEVNDNSITIYNQATVSEIGVAYRFNESNVTYICLLWY